MAFSLADATTASIENARYTASFALRHGDSNDDDAVDIIDYGIWYVDFGPAATTDRSNFNAEGFVNNADFAWLGLHIFQRGESCGGFVPEGEPLRRISVKELRRRGLGDLAGADVNRDGWLDLRDMLSALSTAAAPLDLPNGSSRLILQAPAIFSALSRAIHPIKGRDRFVVTARWLPMPVVDRRG